MVEERLAQLAPDQIDAALKQNINLKIEVQQRGIELKKLKKLVIELERELEEKLEEREREVRELRRRVGEGDAALREAEAHNALLEEELENVKGLLEENTDEMERLKEIVEERGGEDTFNSGSGALKRRIEDLEAENRPPLQTNLPNPNPRRKRRSSRRNRSSPPRHRRAPPPARRRVRRAISIPGPDP